MNSIITEVSLLTIEEYKINKNLIKNKNFCWWLKDAGLKKGYVSYVDNSFGLNSFGTYAGNTGIAILPILKINMNVSNIEVGERFFFKGKCFTLLNGNILLLEKPIEYLPFNQKWEMEDSNVYEKSDIKKIIDNWYKKFILC